MFKLVYTYIVTDVAVLIARWCECKWMFNERRCCCRCRCRCSLDFGKNEKIKHVFSRVHRSSLTPSWGCSAAWWGYVCVCGERKLNLSEKERKKIWLQLCEKRLDSIRFKTSSVYIVNIYCTVIISCVRAWACLFSNQNMRMHIESVGATAERPQTNRKCC